MNPKLEICKAFNLQAIHYEKVALMQQESGTQLIERLDYLKINPEYILDLGSGCGQFTEQLKKKYPKAVVIGVDIAHHMLLVSKKKQHFWKKWPVVNADMNALPFADGVFDLVFSNQVIHWADSIPQLFKELNRVMRVNGCLMFSSLGPDTFKELSAAWSLVDSYAHINPFLDMHDIGDSLLHEQFVDPVMDMDQLTVHYDSLKLALTSLKQQGVRNINPKRRPGLTGKKTWTQFCAAYESFKTTENKYPISYEIVYGHAWKGEKKGLKNKETSVPLSYIKRTIRN